MKRTIMLLAFCAICKIAAFGQAKYEMNVKKTDGMENVFNVEDIKRVYFRERNDGGGTSGGGGTKTPGEAIDLGLPSGTLWASCNVGATKSEEYGGYYAWGETEEKEKYTWSTYKWCDGTSTKLTKYCSKSEYGIVDNKYELDQEDDVAHVKWGGDWRMPTIRELWEMIENTTKEWITQNGVIGCKYTSKTNGNSIFLPAAGAYYGDGITGVGGAGNYWTQIGNLSSSESSNAVVHHVNSKYLGTANVHNLDLAERDAGYSVRPVCSSRSSANKSPSTNAIMQGLGNTSDQTQYEMVIEKNDGTEIVFNIEDIKPVYFRERNDGGGNTETPGDVIDLGLPSGTMWASCNVGATKPEEYGGYFAWGETEEKGVYDWSTYKWCNGSSTTQKKYCTYFIYGTVDNKTVLDMNDDVAYVKWGGKWRMPTTEDFNELLINTTSEWTTMNGVEGRKFTSKLNGNFIFLPAAGGLKGSRQISDKVSYGYYWSSSGRNQDATCLYEFSGLSGVNLGQNNDRCIGMSVRPVLSANLSLSTKTIKLALGETHTVEINSGSGRYGVTNQNSTIAEATLGRTTVSISGLALGEAKVVVTDLQTGQKVEITVTVTATNIESTPGEAIDLGLPSGVKWASCNVGAAKPEDYGGYYAWGETKEKDKYSDITYKWYDTYDPYSLSDNTNVLMPEDDVAHVKWGGNWYMPTENEVKELLDNTKSEWTTINGVKGCKFTSKTNGNSIFLPAAGCFWYSNLNGVNTSGNYWSASVYESYPNNAYFLDCNSGGAKFSFDERYEGRSVRPIQPRFSNLSLSSNTIKLAEGETSTVKITTGSGVYHVTYESSTNAKARAWLQGTTVFIRGFYFGEDEVVVTDLRTEQQIIITVTVTTNSIDESTPGEAIDLGLPSGLKWASCNVGAKKPEEYGNYYAWGNIYITKWLYNLKTYGMYNGQHDYYEWYGHLDKKTVLEPQHDVAHVRWGGNWRMPTIDDVKELLDNTKSEWTIINDVKGCKFTSKTNGNSIFLPAAGYVWEAEWDGVGSYGLYWTSIRDDNWRFAQVLYFNSGGAYTNKKESRHYGIPVRPVR